MIGCMSELLYVVVGGKVRSIRRRTGEGKPKVFKQKK